MQRVWSPPLGGFFYAEIAEIARRIASDSAVLCDLFVQTVRGRTDELKPAVQLLNFSCLNSLN